MEYETTMAMQSSANGIASVALSEKTRRPTLALRLGMLLLAVACLGCRTPANRRESGAIFGGLTGAGIGAVIGKANGNTAAGALIGSAVGAMTGSAIGDSVDADIAANQALVEQKMGRRMANAVDIPDVIAMSQAGLGDQVITTHVRTHGMKRPLSAHDLITLKNAGVTDVVINAMQAPPVGPPIHGRPVIIEEHYYDPHAYPYGHPYYRPGVSWGVEIGH